MACTLLELTQDTCVASDGGIKQSFLIDSAKINASGITHTSEVISAITTSKLGII